MNRYHVGYTIPTFATGWITGALHVYASSAREAERKALESLEDDDAKVVSCYKVPDSSKHEWVSVRKAIDHYYELGYEIVERNHTEFELALGDNRDSRRVSVWYDLTDHKAYSEEQ